METGHVKWFDNKKGYGFIESDRGEDIFVHYSNIAADGYKSLEKGDLVEYEVVEGGKGLQAQNVKRAPQ